MKGYIIFDDTVIHPYGKENVSILIGFGLYRLYKEDSICHGNNNHIYTTNSRYRYELILRGDTTIFRHMRGQRIKIIIVSEEDEFNSFEFDGSSYEIDNEHVSLYGFAKELENIPDILTDDNISFKHDMEYANILTQQPDIVFNS